MFWAHFVLFHFGIRSFAKIVSSDFLWSLCSLKSRWKWLCPQSSQRDARSEPAAVQPVRFWGWMSNCRKHRLVHFEQQKYHLPLNVNSLPDSWWPLLFPIFWFSDFPQFSSNQNWHPHKTISLCYSVHGLFSRSAHVALSRYILTVFCRERCFWNQRIPRVWCWGLHFPYSSPWLPDSSPGVYFPSHPLFDHKTSYIQLCPRAGGKATSINLQFYHFVSKLKF